MTEPQVTASPRVTSPSRFFGTTLVVAGLLILTSAFFPRPDDPADHERFLTLLVEHATRTKVVLVAVPIGIWLLVLGLAVFPRLADGALASAAARFGFLGGLCAAAVVTVQFALAAGALAEGESSLGVYLFAASGYVRSFSLVLLWLALGAVGLSVALSRVLPGWTGVGLLLLSAAMVATSGATVLTGPTTEAATVTGGLAALTAVWLVLLGLRVRNVPVAPR